jgi:hypothetical protein
MAYAFVQLANEASNAASATTIVATFPAPTTAGNLLVAWAYYANTGGTSIDAGSITDDGSNSWTAAPSGQTLDGSSRLRMFYKLSSASATNITCTYSATAAERGLMVAEYSGIASFIVDISPAGGTPGSGTDAVTTGNFNVTSQPALVVSAAFDYAVDTIAIAAGTGLTSRGTRWTLTGGNPMARLQDKRVTATGNTTATATGGYGGHFYKITAMAFAESTGSIVNRESIRRGVGRGVLRGV